MSSATSGDTGPDGHRKKEGETGVTRTIGSLALAAALITGLPSQAEAGGTNTLKIDSPEAARLTVDLKQMGVKEIQFKQGMRLGIFTDRGTIYLPENSGKTPDAQVTEALKGVSGASFLNELERQNARNEMPISEKITTSHGEFRLKITPYARVAMQQMGITYQKGVLSKDGYRVNLTGEGSAEPNTECELSGTGTPFKDLIEAACREIKIVGGKPQIIPVTYHIDSNLTPTPIQPPVK